jgi:hypothetical protein
MRNAAAQREAVRLAKERLGEATSEEMADYIRETFGLTIRPFIVSVLLGTLREREELERTNQAVRERLEAWKTENPEEARKLAAAARRKESARRKAKAAEEGSADASAPPAPETGGGAATAALPGMATPSDLRS